MRFRCAGCGAVVEDDPYPFRCPRAGTDGDVEHVLEPCLAPLPTRLATDPGGQPFVRFREWLACYRAPRARGMGESAWIDLVGWLDERVACVDGAGFAALGVHRHEDLARAAGLGEGTRLWVRDETRDVAGSHKARHLFGVMVWLLAHERLLGLPRRRLAIASCGNAALAAAVVARAADRTLEVFVPPEAEPCVLARLRELGAHVTTCPRTPGPRGDPCHHALRAAVAEGALAFSCQGPDCAPAIEGGATIAFEMAAALAAAGQGLDALFVQVGGGALASALARGFAQAHAVGALPRRPSLYCVQTEAVAPLQRAWERLRKLLPEDPGPADVERALAHAASHRSEFMTPWPDPRPSRARGILDDETYDWLALVRAMLETGGEPIVVSEEEVSRAHALARTHTAVPVSPTGAAGLAGALAGARRLACGAHVGVLFTGREPEPRS